jgi:hypothetical protein
VRLVVVVAVAVLFYVVLLLALAPALVAEARDVLGQRVSWLARPWPRPVERRLAGARERRTPPGDKPSGYRPTPLQERLLAVALSEPGRAVEAWRSLPEDFSLDERHELEPGTFELLPLVYRNLASTCGDDPRLPRLKGIYRRSWVRNNLLLNGTREIADALQAAGVPALFLEGPVVAVRFYGDLALRPSSFVHLLVAREDVAEASARLAGHGWTERPGSGAQPGWRILSDGHGGFCVLRSSLAFDFVATCDERAEAPLWEAAEAVQVERSGVPVPDPTDALLAACVGGVRYGPLPSTQWLVDAAMILRGHELDWDRLVSLAVTRGQRLRLREALGCVLDLPVPVPERVAEAHEWLGSEPVARRERLAFALSSGALARRGGAAPALAELLASSPGEPLLRTAARLPGLFRARWGLAHDWQLPFAAGRRVLAAARRG